MASTPLPFSETRAPVLEVMAGPLFRRRDFAAWLNRRVGKGLATWHQGGAPNEYSDVFVVYDNGEGDEQADNPDGMPRPAWERVCRTAEAAGLTYCLVRLLNTDPM